MFAQFAGTQYACAARRCNKYIKCYCAPGRERGRQRERAHARQRWNEFTRPRNVRICACVVFPDDACNVPRAFELNSNKMRLPRRTNSDDGGVSGSCVWWWVCANTNQFECALRRAAFLARVHAVWFNVCFASVRRWAGARLRLRRRRRRVRCAGYCNMVCVLIEYVYNRVFFPPCVWLRVVKTSCACARRETATAWMD